MLLFKSRTTVTKSCPTLCYSMYCCTSRLLCPPLSPSLLKFMSFESVMPPNHLILCRPLLLLPSVFSSISLFQCVGSLHQVVRGLELQHQSFSECSGLISFRIDWFDLLAIQGTLKSLLQHCNSKAAVLQCTLLPFP